ncbi:MAG TPA: hypothetical protein PKC87_00150 [Candidatus Absconditabacterales bacterium]|nr:hypothetical protein [Candidatus Absconditabacterales bacterium]
MKRLLVEGLSEFSDMFREKDVEMTTSIRDSIQEALDQNKRTANLFEVEFEGVETIIEISLPKSQWKIALENCLKHFHEWEMPDDEIDTFLLLKKLKEDDNNIK